MASMLLTDVYDARPEAVLSIARCLKDGVVLAVVQSVRDLIGNGSTGFGWYFAVYAIAGLLEVRMAWMLRRHVVR